MQMVASWCSWELPLLATCSHLLPVAASAAQTFCVRGPAHPRPDGPRIRHMPWPVRFCVRFVYAWAARHSAYMGQQTLRAHSGCCSHRRAAPCGCCTVGASIAGSWQHGHMLSCSFAAGHEAKVWTDGEWGPVPRASRVCPGPLHLCALWTGTAQRTVCVYAAVANARPKPSAQAAESDEQRPCACACCFGGRLEAKEAVEHPALSSLFHQLPHPSSESSSSCHFTQTSHLPLNRTHKR